MKYKLGQRIDKFTIKNGKKVLLRTIRRNDTGQLLKFFLHKGKYVDDILMMRKVWTIKIYWNESFFME